MLYGILKSTNAGETWDTVMQVTTSNPTNLFTPDIRHGWAAASGKIYRYDYVTPVSIQPISNKLIQFGEAFTYQVEATGMGLKYTMSGNPAGLTIGYRTGLMAGTPTQGGSFPITVTVKDTDANVVNTQFSLRVNRQPVFITNINDTVYTQFNYLYEQILEAEDIDDDTLNFAAIIIPSFLTLTQESSSSIYTATVQGTPTEADTGYHNIKIEVNDGYGGSDTISWVLCVDNVTGVKDNQEIFEFSLNQNYPNPFNPVTKIKFTIPASPKSSPKERTFVQLIVYDLLGREAAVLVNEEKQPGVYE
ncbi:MAG: putative Ig domain-containing protein, partial [Ignavibacteriaceae bacterium]|nr:putative Ig domain-containing protein [Ignavibacteriaceae bacterium]